jgi:hypothetical protein
VTFGHFWIQEKIVVLIALRPVRRDFFYELVWNILEEDGIKKVSKTREGFCKSEGRIK